MAGRYGKKARKRNIDELALEHVFVHHNDRSGGVRARMNRTFGRQETNLAIRRAHELRIIIDPTFKNTVEDRIRILRAPV